MKGFLAVARTEMADRRSILAAAALASLVPIAVALVRGFTGADAVAARSWTAMLLSVAFGIGLPIGLGVSALAPAIASRRIGFDFARPTSAFAIWGGRLAAASLLAIATSILVWVPSAIVGAEVPWRDLLPLAELPRLWPLILLGGLLVLFAISHAASIAFRSRSALIAVDVALAVATGLAVSAALSRLPAFLAPEPLSRAAWAFALSAGAALLVAGYASVARGRTEIRAAHRTLSTVLWTIVALAALGVNGYATWVRTAKPADLPQFWATPAPSGSWVELQGHARGAVAVFLYETASGRFQRLAVVGWRGPAISLDGKTAVWIEGEPRGGPFEVRTLRLDDPNATVVRTRLLLQGHPYLLVPSPEGSRLATVESGILSIHDLAAQKTLVSARLADERASVRGFFTQGDRFRIYRQTDTTVKSSRLEILELDIASKSLRKTGEFEQPGGGFSFISNARGDRLIAVGYRDKETSLLDGRSGALIGRLASGAAGMSRWPGFLSDGRIVLSERSEHGARLRIFLPDGKEKRAIALPPGRFVRLGGEAAPGQLVAAVGDGSSYTSYLVGVEGGVRKLDEGLYPVAHLAGFSLQPNLAPAVGSEATKLFYGPENSLVRLDPLTGERRVILGGGKRP